jgi:glycosyltransferase involved in cell wall biosynthesis
VGRVAARLSGVPVIIHTFHGHFFHSYFSKRVSKFIARVERKLGEITTAAVALSVAQKDELVNKYKIIPAEKVEIIPLGFAFDQENDAQKLRAHFRSRYGLADTDVAVGIVGRIVAVKNHSFFNEVIRQVLAGPEGARAAFFIVGDGDLRGQVEAELKAKDISYSTDQITSANRVVITSWITDMYEVMNGLDIIALTSLNEGTPLSVIEAQFFKRPIVSTDAGGVKDTMKDGVSGFITGREDIPGFTEKLKLLINNSQLRQTMGEAGFEFAEEKFSKDKEIERTKKLYFSLLKK